MPRMKTKVASVLMIVCWLVICLSTVVVAVFGDYWRALLLVIVGLILLPTARIAIHFLMGKAREKEKVKAQG